jgi:hypothetical protein
MPRALPCKPMSQTVYGYPAPQAHSSISPTRTWQLPAVTGWANGLGCPAAAAAQWRTSNCAGSEATPKPAASHRRTHTVWPYYDTQTTQGDLISHACTSFSCTYVACLMKIVTAYTTLLSCAESILFHLNCFYLKHTGRALHRPTTTTHTPGAAQESLPTTLQTSTCHAHVEQ